MVVHFANGTSSWYNEDKKSKVTIQNIFICKCDVGIYCSTHTVFRRFVSVKRMSSLTIWPRKTFRCDIWFPWIKNHQTFGLWPRFILTVRCLIPRIFFPKFLHIFYCILFIIINLDEHKFSTTMLIRYNQLRLNNSRLFT